MFTFEPIMDTVLSALSMLLVYRTSTIDTFFANDTSLEMYVTSICYVQNILDVHIRTYYGHRIICTFYVTSVWSI